MLEGNMMSHSNRKTRGWLSWLGTIGMFLLFVVVCGLWLAQISFAPKIRHGVAPQIPVTVTPEAPVVTPTSLVQQWQQKERKAIAEMSKHFAAESDVAEFSSVYEIALGPDVDVFTDCSQPPCMVWTCYPSQGSLFDPIRLSFEPEINTFYLDPSHPFVIGHQQNTQFDFPCYVLSIVNYAPSLFSIASCKVFIPFQTTPDPFDPSFQSAISSRIYDATLWRPFSHRP